MDGTFDGEYRPMADLMASCNELPPTQLLRDLTLLNSEGCCPEDLLDGVGTTALKGPTCSDVWGTRCAAVIAAGAMTCDIDFCDNPPTAAAPCDLMGLCDDTCGLCGHGEDGGHRRQLLLDDLRRHLQMSFGTCDPSSFSDQAATVDRACCDADGSACTHGTPDACDAKCAIVYTDFYRRCQSLLGTLSLTLIDSYDRLYATCDRGMPSEPLLRVVALCTSDPRQRRLWWPQDVRRRARGGRALRVRRAVLGGALRGGALPGAAGARWWGDHSVKR